jgi:cell wall-associated NlpC family hydrolase
MKGCRGLLLLVVGVFLIAVASGGVTAIIHKSKPVTTAAQAISYAEAQLGKPYCYGGPTSPSCGPGTFDCSGLVYEAYGFPWSLRTSQWQWEHLKHVSKPVKGDLVFFHGLLSQGEQPPGHVGIVISSHEMIDAYALGFPVEYDTFGLPGSKQGLTAVWGYADP